MERVPLGTPPQAIVMSLAHNHMTNLFTQSLTVWLGVHYGENLRSRKECLL